MSINFSNTETQLRKLFSNVTSFSFLGKLYTPIVVGKPSPPKGECKTDIYILAEDDDGEAKEFKISVKQKNADFLENKIKLERALEIFGDDATTILTKSIESIKSAFESDFLVYFDANNEKRNKITLGWKFEIMNKKSGNKSGLLLLSDQQKVEVYAGHNLSFDKKDSKINGVIYENSGVANYILEVDSVIDRNVDFYINQLLPIEEFVRGKELFFACKALNYRVNVDKWDGNRPLAVFIDWELTVDKVTSKIVYDRPLQIRGNEIGEKVRTIIRKLNIDSDNFLTFEKYLQASVRKKKY